VKRFLGFVLFLVFVDDFGLPYVEHFGAPFGWVQTVLLDPTPVKVRPFDFLLLFALISASGKKKGASVGPMKTTLLICVATTVFFYVYGLARGGDARAASWQTYLIMSTVLLAFTVAATFRTAADYEGLAKWLIAAAIYRAAMCWLSYFTWGHHVSGESGAFLTSHDDTITWVVSLLILTVNAVDKRSTKVSIRNGLLSLFLMGAIQFNSRRLAWVSLAMGFVVLYVLFPAGIAKRRINRFFLSLAPVLSLYVAVGWTQPEKPIFFPLRAFFSTTTQEDGSTLARNAENLGLISTSWMSSLQFGTGWGKPYHFLTMKYDISHAFELWQYVPHNSILGLLAFTGYVGFAGFWMVLPTAVFLNARLAKVAEERAMRNVGLIGAAQMIVCTNQLYGDMGIFFLRSMYVLAISYAIALSLPTAAGVWGTTKRAPAARA
jgi:hypothetical protein